MTYMEMLQNYYAIKAEQQSYRLGQHMCNTVGLAAGKGVDLFNVEDDELAVEMFSSVAENYQWDWDDLKCFK